MSFGQIIADARKKANLSLRELATRVLKDDGQAISPQYLNDIEHDRRNPPSDSIMQQLALELNISIDVLYFHAGEIPAELRGVEADPQQVIEAYRAFRRTLQKDEH